MRRLLGLVLSAVLVTPLVEGPLRRTVSFVHLDGCCCDSETPPDKCCCRTDVEEKGDGIRLDRSCRIPQGSADATFPGRHSFGLAPRPLMPAPSARTTSLPDVPAGRPSLPARRAPDHIPLLPA